MFDFYSEDFCQKIFTTKFLGPWSVMTVGHAQVLKNETVLDIGCGTGEAARYAAKLSGPAGSIYGVDCQIKLLQKARKLDPHCTVKWCKTELANLPFEDKTFDALVGSQIYQFLFNRDLVLQECHRILKPGGRLVLNILSRQELCPAHNAVIKALENCNIHATNLKKLFSQNDPVTIGNFISTHGFKDISVVRKTLETTFLSSRSFVTTLAKSDPTILSDFKKLKNNDHEKVIEHVTQELHSNIVDAGVRVLSTANFVFARRR